MRERRNTSKNGDHIVSGMTDRRLAPWPSIEHTALPKKVERGLGAISLETGDWPISTPSWPRTLDDRLRSDPQNIAY